MRIAWSRSGARRQLARLCALLAMTAFVATAARPSIPVEPASREGTLELVVDVSGSTQADDVAPTRLDAIQRSTVRLIDRLPPRVRVGLVSFSGAVQTLARPTADRAAVKGKIAGLTTGPATAIGNALERALDDLQASHPAGPVWLLLISDGANTAGLNPRESARLAGQRHVPILAVAVGRPDGTVEVNGQLIPVPPDPEQLTTLARESGGEALAARSADELETALGDLVWHAGLEGGHRDLTLPFAAATLLLLAITRALRPAPRPARRRRSTAPRSHLPRRAHRRPHRSHRSQRRRGMTRHASCSSTRAATPTQGSSSAPPGCFATTGCSPASEPPRSAGSTCSRSAAWASTLVKCAPRGR